MPMLQLSTVRLQYDEYGHGPNVLVFVHGFQASGRIWRLVCERLPADEYRCIAFYNRGAGESDAPPDDDAYGCQPFADDLFEATTALGLHNPVLVGHSMGGATVMQFAVDHPDVPRALVLLDPAGPNGIRSGGGDADAVATARVERRRPITGESLLARGSRVAWPEGFAEALAADMNAAPPQRLRGSYRSMLNLRIGEAVSRLPMPILLIAGDADETVPLADMLDTYRLLPPGSGLHVWHGVGHSPNLEVPDRLVGVLSRFVEKTVPARLVAAASN